MLVVTFLMKNQMIVQRMVLLSLLKQLPYELNATLYLSIFSFITLLFVFVFVLTRRRSRTNLPPSPPKLPIIGNLHQLGTLPHRSFRALSLKYGPLLWLQLGQVPALLVSSADLARELIKTHDVVFANRVQNISARTLLYGCKDIAYASYGEEWRQKRKICVLELLSLKRVQSFYFIREEEVARLVNKIRKACLSGSFSVNISETLNATANSIICRCIIGQRYDTEDSSSRFGELARKEMVQLVDFCVGDFFPSLGWIDILTGKIREFKDTFGALDAFFDQVIADHKKVKNEDDKKDLADILLQLQQGDTLNFELDQDDIKALLTDMFLGGNETTSTTLEWAMAELMRNPSTVKKAQEEVRRVVGNNSKVKENDINQMKYLKCVIKETLRLHPPAPLLVLRETRSSAKLGGHDIPPKSMVFVNAWAIQRDPELWDRSEEFLPERFENSKIDFKGQDFEFIPFGSGRRMCPGMAFGLASVEYELANLLYWFDWKLPVSEIDMSEALGLTVKKKVPLHLQPIPYTPSSC